MARTRGRVIVPKVDKNGDKIKDFKRWRKKNPTAMYFDSIPEWEVWEHLAKVGISHTFHPASIELLPAITTTEFQHPRRTKKAVKEGRVKPVLKKVTQRKMEYTPDFYLDDYDVYIEVKGYADEQFKMRWKLFKAKGYEGYIVYSLNEFKELLKQLKVREEDDTNKTKS
jgi:hypothetical protein